MKEPFIIKLAALGGSLLGFYFAKENKREVVPMMMVGGFLAGCLADWVIPNPEVSTNKH